MVTTYFERVYTRQTARGIYHSYKSIVNEISLFIACYFRVIDTNWQIIRPVATHQLKGGLHERFTC